jgi:hypothetical protein
LQQPLAKVNLAKWPFMTRLLGLGRQGGDITSAYLDPRSARFFLVVATAQPRRTVVMRPEEYGPPHPAAAVDVPRSEDLFHAT